MPTLIEEYTIEQTARDSEIAWVHEEFRNDNDDDDDDDANDTTLSGSLLEAALDNFRKTQKSTSPSQMFSPPPQHKTMDQSVSLLGSPDLLPPQTPQFALTPAAASRGRSSSSSSTSPPPPPPPPPLPSTGGGGTQKSIVFAAHERASLDPGPNQLAYQAHYKDFVAKVLEKCRTQHPGKIPKYSELPDDEKRAEQDRVLQLLERLELGGRQGGEDGDEPMVCSTPASKLPRSSQCASTATKKKTTLSFALNDESKANSSPGPPLQDDESMETSMALLSPSPKKKHSNTTNKKIPHQALAREPSASPVEISRAAARFSSPRPLALENELSDSYRKRMATSSGKRGADASRRKRDSEALPTMDLQSPQPKIFSASQSPIMSDSDDAEDNPRRLRHDQYSGDSSVTSAGSNISFGHDVGGDDCDDTFDSIDDTALHSRPPLGSVGNSLQLKPGASLHFRPLATTHRRPKTKETTQTFVDPLDRYNGKTFDKMKATYKWLRRRLESKSLSGGAIFSLSEQKIIDICLKLAVRTAQKLESQEMSQPGPSDSLIGQTLIVVRERDSLEEWKRAFREGSNIGLLSHCELPLKERRSVSTAQKCSNYGVVLTTFDALSSPDSTITVDEEEGVAIVEQSQDQNGWLQGRGSSQSDTGSSNCQRLSVLHRLNWTQVIFVDTLGRKSYLAKPGTSRNKAAAVLPTTSRVAFFAKDSDSPSGFAELVKSDKKALSGLAAVLHTDWERVGDGDYRGKGITLDYEHALRIRTTSQKKSS